MKYKSICSKSSQRYLQENQPNHYQMNQQVIIVKRIQSQRYNINLM